MRLDQQPSDGDSSPIAVESLLPVFQPRSVAVIGASRKPEGLDFRLLAALVKGDFPGTVYPINPQAPVLAVKQAFASVVAVPGSVDLALIVVPCQEMLDLAAALDHQPLPHGARVGVRTKAGGPAILCAETISGPCSVR